MWDCISCKNFIPEKEELDFFREQADKWLEKVNNFKSQIQLYENFMNLSSKYGEFVDIMERM